MLANDVLSYHNPVCYVMLRKAWEIEKLIRERKHVHCIIEASFLAQLGVLGPSQDLQSRTSGFYLFILMVSSACQFICIYTINLKRFWRCDQVFPPAN
jgi:hypothetical protein